MPSSIKLTITNSLLKKLNLVTSTFSHSNIVNTQPMIIPTKKTLLKIQPPISIHRHHTNPNHHSPRKSRFRFPLCVAHF